MVFESNESKTPEGGIVFNEITFSSSEKIDIWRMKQSHHGLSAQKWDYIEIRVDKNEHPYRATFHQLNENAEEIEYRASCIRCHSGGPRLIRPNLNSVDATLSLGDRIAIAKWNAVIKSYGHVINHETKGIKREVALHSLPKHKRELLNVKTCTTCHSENSIRAPLTNEQIVTIKHLVDQGEMPPWPYKLSPMERRELNQFIFGI